ncbi:cycloartenol synthase [Nannochloropsis gaditana]|uniref:Cycloartenol synthase n=1 Tax=Nannochloropsis gaditana TaxID=72520 RepID=W7TZB6_9STRA|nr:cycloartenol synthase [Nannochloropsis gaditana]
MVQREAMPGFWQTLLEKRGSSNGDACVMLPLLATILCILGASIYSSYIARPTSYPGGPRAQKQKRRAAWLPRSSIFSPGWVFAEAETSVAVTEREVLTLLGEPVPLTGEAAGRQTWHWDPKKGKDLAGRKADYSFSAARNPNSADKVFRTQQVNQWKGPRPNSKSRPKTAREAAHKAMAYYQMLQCEDG